METIHDFLAESVTLRLFTVIGLGYIVGSWRVRSFSLGVAAVLFVGLAFGAWDPKAFEIPSVVAALGLALFVYTIGLASGPGVVQALRSPVGLRLNALALSAVLIAAFSTVVLTRVAGLSGSEAAGLFCGAVTNTPALAAQMEMQQRRALQNPNQSPLDGPVVGYSVAYPFGVLGVFLVMTLLSGANQKDQQLHEYEKETGTTHGTVSSRNYRVTRIKPNGNKLEVGWLKEQSGLVVARRLHDLEIDTVEPDTVLEIGDIVSVVGDAEMHARALELVGEPAQEHLETQHGQVTYGRFFVSNPKLIGTRLGNLHLEAHRVTVTRLRRGDVELTASSNWILEVGDVLRVVGRPEDLERVGKLLGDSLEQIAHTDFLSISLGMVLGVLLGAIPIPFGEAPYPTLGVAGGCLVVGLLLGKLRRTGNIVWTLSLEANLALRQIGLLFFLATVGIQAGGQFSKAMQKDGLLLMGCGALITLTSALVIALAGRFLLKINLIPLLGVIAGAHTQPACLAYANSLVKSEGISIGYSTVFAMAMIIKIVVATWLLGFLAG